MLSSVVERGYLPSGRTPVVGVSDSGDFFQRIFFQPHASDVARGVGMLVETRSSSIPIDYSRPYSFYLIPGLDGGYHTIRPGVISSHDQRFSYSVGADSL